MKKSRVIFEPGSIHALGEEGNKVIDLAREKGINIYKPCGGQGTCGKCRVIVENSISKPNEKEVKILSKEEIGNNTRLACQTPINDGMLIKVLMDNDTYKTKILANKENLKNIQIKPFVKKQKIVLNLEKYKDDINSISEVISNALEFKKIKFSIKALQEVSELYNPFTKNLAITVVYTEDMVLSIEDMNNDIHYGVGVDIGTTTVVAYLMNIMEGEQVAISSRLNPQVEYGDDVVTRINYIIQNENGLSKLKDLIVNTINDQICELCKEANINKKSIYEVSIAANTTMQHIFSGINPKSIGIGPYFPIYKKITRIRASDIGLNINGMGLVTLLPNLSGYIGSDVLAGAYLTNISNSEKIKAIIDIGTNNEVILGNKDFMVGCSSAAGPAFEGAKISSGMRGTTGAIEKIRHDNNKMNIQVIGNVEPKGICGSGLVDIVSEMLRLGIIDSSGRLNSDENISNIDLKDRLTKNKNNISMFRITEKDSNNQIYLTQKDIREVQLAKGAVLGGLNILLRHVNKTIDDVDEIYLAGAFGNYLNKKSAINIGLFPEIDVKKIKLIGNSSALGASMALLSEDVFVDMSKLIKKIEYIELSTYPTFQKEFINDLSFPKKVKYY
ncbi:MAG: ASKHA domain-containing protein [Tissierellia bacterium]|nr:ASKHA domain-containing protein [Tissierellia bacterium]